MPSSSSPFPSRRVPSSRFRSVAPRAGAVAAVLCLALTGCGSQDGGEEGSAAGHDGTHVMPDGSTMSDAEMEAMHEMDGGGPSEAAAMICTPETADAVRRTFALAAVPPATDGWDDPVYSCAFELAKGNLRLSVVDFEAGPKARARFEEVRADTPGAHRIPGMQSLGLPSFETEDGRVGFLKDGRTLVVDARGVTGADLPPGFTRTGAAYGVASAVVACWTE
jgi:hypothetical protein